MWARDTPPGCQRSRTSKDMATHPAPTTTPMHHLKEWYDIAMTVHTAWNLQRRQQRRRRGSGASGSVGSSHGGRQDTGGARVQQLPLVTAVQLQYWSTVQSTTRVHDEQLTR